MKNLTATFGKTAPSKIIVFRWYSKFKRGRRLEDDSQTGSLEDWKQTGHSATAASTENVEAVTV